MSHARNYRRPPRVQNNGMPSAHAIKSNIKDLAGVLEYQSQSAKQRPTDKNFAAMNLHPLLMKGIMSVGYTEPTPIQHQAFAPIAKGRDVIGTAQTGTGKTAAFALPILQRLLLSRQETQRPRGPKVLVLTPTRELAMQVRESFATYGQYAKLRSVVVYGGVGQAPQVHALQNQPAVLIATPGRLLDLAQQRHVNFEFVTTLVLDEADRLLDMGFIHDVRRIIGQLPRDRQTLLFSATMPKAVETLAGEVLTNPITISVDPPSSAAVNIDHRLYRVSRGQKKGLLTHILSDASLNSVLVFTRTKHTADRVAHHLESKGIHSRAIHSNKSQSARQKALHDFKTGETRVLVASDIAARGIDVDGISHVVNFDLPEVPETYVHRVGRTARAKASGVALSFCDAGDRALLRAIERHLGHRLTVVENHPFHEAAASEAPQSQPCRENQRRGHRYGSCHSPQRVFQSGKSARA